MPVVCPWLTAALEWVKRWLTTWRVLMLQDVTSIQARVVPGPLPVSGLPIQHLALPSPSSLFLPSQSFQGQAVPCPVCPLFACSQIFHFKEGRVLLSMPAPCSRRAQRVYRCTQNPGRIWVATVRVPSSQEPDSFPCFLNQIPPSAPGVVRMGGCPRLVSPSPLHLTQTFIIHTELQMSSQNRCGIACCCPRGSLSG